MVPQLLLPALVNDLPPCRTEWYSVRLETALPTARRLRPRRLQDCLTDREWTLPPTSAGVSQCKSSAGSSHAAAEAPTCDPARSAEPGIHPSKESENASRHGFCSKDAAGTCRSRCSASRYVHPYGPLKGMRSRAIASFQVEQRSGGGFYRRSEFSAFHSKRPASRGAECVERSRRLRRRTDTCVGRTDRSQFFNRGGDRLSRTGCQPVAP